MWPVVAVQLANHFREVGALNVRGGLRGEGLECGRILRSIGLHGGGDVLVAKCKTAKEKPPACR